jgi:hypothetical protein
MVEDINLKGIEKKAYRSQFEDGLMDMLFAFVFISIAIGQLATLIIESETLAFLIFYFICYFIGFSFVYFLKKKYVIPRTGKVKYGKKRKRRKRWLIIIILFFVIITSLVFLIDLSDNIYLGNMLFEGFAVLLFIATFFVLFPLVIIAYFIDFPRMYIIALMGFLGILLIEVFHLFNMSPYNFVIIFGSIGLIVLTWSLIIFLRFLKKYPISNQNSK